MDSDLQRQADAAASTGDFRTAMVLLERLLDVQDGDCGNWMKLASLRRATGDHSGALAATNRALDAKPNDFLALLFKAGLHETLTDRSLAAELYAAALFHAPSEALPAPVTARLAHARDYLARHRDAMEAALKLDEFDGADRALARRFVENVVDRRPVFHQQPTHYRFPGLPDIEFFDFAYPDLLARMRENTPAILAEYQMLYAAHGDRQQPYVDFASGQPQAQWAPLNRSPRWNALHLLRHGAADPVNAAVCPQAMAAFAGADQAHVPGVGPNLMFSLLAPHTRIPPHHGIANFRVVVHLPLIVPPGCGFRVGSETRAWVPGQPWIFDDTIEHEAWNDSPELRVVLIGDLWRPELTPPQRLIVARFMAQHGAEPGAGSL